MRVELVRGRVSLKPAVAHDGDAIGHAERLELIVCHEDRRYADLFLQPLDLAAHVVAQTCVEVRERLVEKQDVGPFHKCAR